MPGCQDVAARLHWLFFTQHKTRFRCMVRELNQEIAFHIRAATRKEK
jgi:hypothetical protein